MTGRPPGSLAIDGGWLLTPFRAAVHIPTATAVVADVHLGYELCRLADGEAVPAAGLDEPLAPLPRLFATHQVERLVVAGDLVEGAPGAPLGAALPDWLAHYGVELVAVVPGNHDRGLDRLAPQLPYFPDGFRVGGWLVVHGDQAIPPGPVIHGHSHPALRLGPTGGGGAAGGPCYLIGPERLVLPAFSADAAGLSVFGVPSWQWYTCAAIAGDRVLDFGPVGSLRQRLDAATRRRPT